MLSIILQEKLKEAERQVALFQGRRQQLEVLEGVAAELKTRLSGLMVRIQQHLFTASVYIIVLFCSANRWMVHHR